MISRRWRSGRAGEIWKRCAIARMMSERVTRPTSRPSSSTPTHPGGPLDLALHRREEVLAVVQTGQGVEARQPHGRLTGAAAALKSAAAALKKSGDGSVPKVLAAFKGLVVDTPFGKVNYRADHQSTMGAFVGRTALQGGRGVMVNYRYEDGAKHLPSEADGVKLRPKQ